MRIVLKDVVAGYGFGDVLRGFDLVAESGEITCLIGPNGAGKSTVLRAVSGLLVPRRGAILLGDEDIIGYSPRRLLSLGVVHVPQERSLFPLMTVWENLLLGGYITHDRGRAASRRGARGALPADRRASPGAGRLPLGRRAEDRRDRPGADARAEGAADRRAVDRPRSQGAFGGLRDARVALRRRLDDPARRAERALGARDRPATAPCSTAAL